MTSPTLLLIAIVVLTGTGGEMAASHVMKQVGQLEHITFDNIVCLLRRTLRLPMM